MRIIGLAGWSGSGKTTLLTKVIPRLVARGLKVSTLKHAHHAFDVDQPGKDSHSHRMAGRHRGAGRLGQPLGAGARAARRAEPTLDALLKKLSPVDLVLVEGYKREPHPKLEVYRAAVGKPLLHPDDPAIVAIASDEPLPAARVPVVDLDDIERSPTSLLAARCAARCRAGACGNALMAQLTDDCFAFSRPAAAGRRDRAHHPRARRAGGRDRDACRSTAARGRVIAARRVGADRSAAVRQFGGRRLCRAPRRSRRQGRDPARRRRARHRRPRRRACARAPARRSASSPARRCRPAPTPCSCRRTCAPRARR